MDNNDNNGFHINKGLLIFCISLLAVIIILTIVLTNVLK